MGTRSICVCGLGASVYRDQEHPCIGTRSIRVSGLEAPVYLMLLQCHEYGLSATFSLLSNSIDHQPFGPFRLLYEVPVPGYIWSEDYEVFLIFPGMRLHTERESCKRIIALPRDIYVYTVLSIPMYSISVRKYAQQEASGLMWTKQTCVRDSFTRWTWTKIQYQPL